MVYKIPPGGGGKPYLASGLMNYRLHLYKVRLRHQSASPVPLIDALESVSISQTCLLAVLSCYVTLLELFPLRTDSLTRANYS